MSFRASTTSGVVCLYVLVGHSALGGEIKVISAVAIRPMLTEITPQFERSSGHKVTFKFVTGPNVAREMDAGEPFDVAITNPNYIDIAEAQGKIVSGSTTNIARGGVGICGRAGSAKPDISTVAALKAALLNAKSIAYTGEGTSGAYFLKLLDRLEISTQMKDKIKPQPGGGSPAAVARDEAELCITIMSQLVPSVPGTQLVGPVPAELQSYIGFKAGIGSAAKEPTAGQALIGFLTSVAATQAFKDYGLEAFTQ
jgi:molybdate transport system substrate-binding protein